MVLNMRNIVDKTILHSSIDNDTRLKLLECVRLFNDIRTAEGTPYDSRIGHIKENGKLGVITSEDFQTFLPQEYETIVVNTISNIVKERVKNGNFKSLDNFINRINPKDINKLQLEGLVKAGAFDTLNNNRQSRFNSIPNMILKSKNNFEKKYINFPVMT